MARSLKEVARVVGHPDNRWPVLLVLFAISGLYASLPPPLLNSLDPNLGLIPLVTVAILAAPLVVTHQKGQTKVSEALAYVLLAILTLFLIISLYLLVSGVIHELARSTELLRSAAALWVTNILIFSCWYWRLDAGGPHKREHRVRHEKGVFLFPQMTMSAEMLDLTDQTNWKPGYWDYLFLAFNSSTALSPTDSPVLSRWAKGLMMLQASISLTIVVLVAARAVNIVGR